jgi:zinc D-Ala-D-Ala dipeptidase
VHASRDGTEAKGLRLVDSTASGESLLSPASVVPARHLPPDAPPLPTFAPGSAIYDFPSLAQPLPNAEPLVDLSQSNLVLLHSYSRAGWSRSVGRQFLRMGMEQRLVRAQHALPTGFGFAIFDAWRPLDLQRELFDAAQESADLINENGVAAPSSDPTTPPPHLTGGAVDLTLTWRGTPLALGTQFDDFSDVARTDAFEDRPGRVQSLRRLMFWTLSAHGMVVLAEEWWHYEYGTRLWSTVTGCPTAYAATHP